MSERISRPQDQFLAQLKDDLLLMGGTVESMMQEARQALAQKNAELAQKIIERDAQVDTMETNIDELAISLLSLHQLAPRDLRFVSSALKITTDIERMGDVVRNICERVIELEALVEIPDPQHLFTLFDAVQEMITKALDSFVRSSSDEASKIIERDKTIDELNLTTYKEMLGVMQSSSDKVEVALKYVYISKYLERIGDHCKNVAEQVIFVAEGLDVRHTDLNSD